MFDCICAICDTKFGGFHKKDKYCSKKCRNRAHNEKKVAYTKHCPECGKLRQVNRKFKWSLCITCFRKYTSPGKLRLLIQAEKMVSGFELTIEQLTDRISNLKTENEALKRAIDVLQNGRTDNNYQFTSGTFNQRTHKR